jgi:hypothetical protein
MLQFSAWIGMKFCSFGHAARYDGGGRRRKDGLKYQVGKAVGIISAQPAAQSDIRGADQSAGIGAEHQAGADKPESQGSAGKIHDIFHHDIGGIFGPRKTRFHHGKSGLHKKDQKSCQTCPENVAIQP